MCSTEVGHGSGEWAFDCDTPQGSFAVLPMLGHRLPDAALAHQLRHARAARLGLRFAMPDTVPTRSIVEHRVEISWDGGQSRARPDRVRCEQTSCTARLRNQPGGTASMRVSAADAGGRLGSRQILDVYEVFNRAATLLVSAPPRTRGRSWIATPTPGLSGL